VKAPPDKNFPFGKPIRSVVVPKADVGHIRGIGFDVTLYLFCFL
jgi:hypothetical protein